MGSTYKRHHNSLPQLLSRINNRPLTLHVIPQKRRRDLLTVIAWYSVTRKPSWSKADARQQCMYKDPWQIILSSSMLPVNFLLLMVNSIRDRILLIVCDIFCIEAESRHFGRYSNVKMAVYPFKVIQGYGLWYQSKVHVHIPISDQ